jgi:hypothetical protein
MERFFWPAGVLIAFALGLAAGAQPWRARVDSHQVERGRARGPAEPAGTAPGGGGGGEARTGSAASGTPGVGTATFRPADPSPDAAAAAAGLARPGQRAEGREGVRPPTGPRGGDTRGPAGSGSASASVDAALARFYRYLDEAAELSGRARWQRARQLVDELRAMGGAGVEALAEVLGSSASSEERRVAAQLLGDLKAAEALPVLQEVLDDDPDILLRRAAASSLRRLGTPDAASAMQSLLADPREDRFVRMSAAAGLAQMGLAQGVAGLVQIFEESNVDGRGRDLAFRTLRTLSDNDTLAFMRRLVTSDAEVTYRLQAIRFLAAQGDLQALTPLQQVMGAPAEQPSIRDAAARAVAAIGGR